VLRGWAAVVAGAVLVNVVVDDVVHDLMAAGNGYGRISVLWK